MTSTPRGCMHEQKDTFQYIPLRKGLQVLLKNKEICNEVSSTCADGYKIVVYSA